jgi:hypothetical protein
LNPDVNVHTVRNMPKNYKKKLSFVVILEPTAQKTGCGLEEPDLDPKSSEQIPGSRSGPVPYHCFKK